MVTSERGGRSSYKGGGGGGKVAFCFEREIETAESSARI